MSNDAKDRLLLPVLFPVGILAVIGLVLFGFSRILLGVSHAAATATAMVVGAGILGVAAAAQRVRKFETSTLAAFVGAVVGVAMLAGGVALAAIGPEKVEEGGGKKAVLALVAPAGAATTGFATTSLTAPADAAFTVAFDNQDAGVPHNFAIMTADPSKDPNAQVLFQGENVTGPAKVSYQVTPLKAGTYFFLCQVHPTVMTGQLTVTPGGGGPGLKVAAQNMAFDTAEIDLPADTPSTISFSNNDGGVPHNISIYSASPIEDPKAEVLFKGDIINGVASVDYQIPALPAGEYYFQCDVHPATMNGKVVVGGAGAAPKPSPTLSFVPSPATSPTAAPSPSPSPSPAPSPSSTQPAGGGGGNTITIVALNMLFDQSQLSFPAGTEVTVILDNQDGGIPHNFSVYRDEGFTDAIFTGEQKPGPVKVENVIPPLDPGTYYFRCDVHPATMTGTITVG